MILFSELSGGSVGLLQIISLKASIFPQARIYYVSSKVRRNHSLVDSGESKGHLHHLLIGIDAGEMHLQLKTPGDHTPAYFPL